MAKRDCEDITFDMLTVKSTSFPALTVFVEGDNDTLGLAQVTVKLSENVPLLVVYFPFSLTW